MFPVLTNRSDGSFGINRFNNIDKLFDELGRALDSTFHSYGYSPLKEHSSSFVPPLEVVEKDGVYDIVLECCGVDKSDISVSVDENNTLVIKGEKKDGFNKEDGDRVVSERYYGEFRREISLPKQSNAEDIVVRYDNGILRATIPKTDPGSKTRQIEIE